MIGMRAHRLELCGTVTQRLQRADPCDSVTPPHAPDAHFGLYQPRKIEREDAAGRRVGVHLAQMQRQKLATLLTRQIVRSNV